MHSILLLSPDDRPFDASAIEQVFRAESGFCDVRLNEPGGAAVESDYDYRGFHTIARLSRDLQRISLSGTSDATLHAALFLQRSLGTPLRMFDTEYSFDLVLEGLPDVEALRCAIENARTS